MATTVMERFFSTVKSEFANSAPRLGQGATAAGPHARVVGAGPYTTTRFVDLAAGTAETGMDWSNVAKRPRCRTASASR